MSSDRKCYLIILGNAIRHQILGLLNTPSEGRVVSLLNSAHCNYIKTTSESFFTQFPSVWKLRGTLAISI